MVRFPAAPSGQSFTTFGAAEPVTTAGFVLQMNGSGYGLKTAAGIGGPRINANGMIVFPGRLRMYLQRDISTGAQRSNK
jgi:hypothetical protein